MGGLNRDIADVVDLHYYRDVEEALQRAVKVEKQLKRRGRSSYPSNTSSRPFPRREEPRKPMVESRRPQNPTTDKGKGVEAPRPRVNEQRGPNTGRTRDVICYKCQGRGHFANQCPNKRTMILDDAGQIITDLEDNDESGEQEEDEPKESSDEEEAIVCREKGMVNFVTIRALNVREKKDEHEVQRENIFHCHCVVKGKICSMIVDNGSCTNVVSEIMIKML